MNLKDRMVEFFTATDKRTDINKDSSGKGTLERFNALVGEYIDDEIYPLVDSIMANLYDPNSNFDRFIPVLEEMVGFHYENRLIYFDNSTYWRRRLLQGALKRYSIKGTIRGYVVLFRMLGLEAVITYSNVGGSFDTGTFDDPLKTFDSFTFTVGASGYTVNLTGSVPYTDVEQAVLNIIKFNEPINAHLTEIIYNNVPIVVGADFDLDFDLDFDA